MSIALSRTDTDGSKNNSRGRQFPLSFPPARVIGNIRRFKQKREVVPFAGSFHHPGSIHFTQQAHQINNGLTIRRKNF